MINSVLRTTVWMFVCCFAWIAMAADRPVSGTVPEKVDPIKAKLEKAIDTEKKKLKSLKEQVKNQEGKKSNLEAELKKTKSYHPTQRAWINLKRKAAGKRSLRDPKKIKADIKNVNNKIKKLKVDISKSEQRLASLMQRVE